MPKSWFESRIVLILPTKLENPPNLNLTAQYSYLTKSQQFFTLILAKRQNKIVPNYIYIQINLVLSLIEIFGQY